MSSNISAWRCTPLEVPETWSEVTYIPIGWSRGWKPSEYIPCHDLRPPVPCLIALNRKPYQLIEIRDISPGSWKETDWKEYNQLNTWARQVGQVYPSPDEWARGPVDFIMTEPGKKQRLMFRVALWETRSDGWFVLDEHYALCASCGELAPCREYVAARDRDYAAAKANEKLERDLQVLPGCCWACNEVITQRQKWIAFEGDNADLPGGPPVRFHLREKCVGDARSYEHRWIQLDPSRRVRLSCPGRVIHHVDGFECSEGPLCPGERASHTSGMSNHRIWVDPICLRCKDARARMIGEP